MNEVKEKENKKSPVCVVKLLEDELMVTHGYPRPLAKACFDSFFYALRLSSGQTVTFAEAKPINREWVEIVGSEKDKEFIHMDGIFTFPRGVVIRVSEIVWVADAPNGS